LELINKTSVKDMFSFSYEVNHNSIYVTKNIEFTIFRVIQEFINNSIRHSACNLISIKISSIDKCLKVFLHDNGNGFNIEESIQKRGNGLLNIKSRIKSHNGTIDISSSKHKGTSFQIIIPLV